MPASGLPRAASAALTLVTDGDFDIPSLLLSTHWKVSPTEFIQSLQECFTLSSFIFCKGTKRKRMQAPYPESKHAQRAHGPGSESQRTMQAVAGGVSFSSAPRGGLLWGAGWWRLAPAGGWRPSCSSSWAGAHCTEGCYSSWCTPSSVSLGSRRTGTRPRRWGRLQRRHTTCDTWSLQHAQGSWVNLCWQRIASCWAQRPVCPSSPSQSRAWVGQGGAFGCFAEPPQYIRCTGKKAVLIAPLWTELFQKQSEMQCQWIKSCQTPPF